MSINFLSFRRLLERFSELPNADFANFSKEQLKKKVICVEFSDHYGNLLHGVVLCGDPYSSGRRCEILTFHNEINNKAISQLVFIDGNHGDIFWPKVNDV